MDPFATLGIERRFDLDLRAVERTVRELSRIVHPDRQSDAPPSSRVHALGKSVEINEALRIVKDPVRRAEALLALAGVPVGDGKEPQPSGAFLMDILEQREALEDAKLARDAAKVRALAEAMEARAETAERALADAFRSGSDHPALARAVEHLGELRFYRRFLEEVSTVEDVLEGLS